MMRWLLTVLLAFGCYHDTATAPPANRAQPPARRASGDVLAYLPVDSEAVIALDLAQVRATAMWQKYEPKMMAHPLVARLKSQCGIDVLAIQRVTLAMRGLGGRTDGVMVVRGLARDAFTRCATDPNLASAGKVTIDHDVFTIANEGGEPLVMTFVDARTAVCYIGANATAATLDELVRAGVPLRSSPAFLDMFGRIDTAAPLWFMINGHNGAFARLGVPMKLAGGSIRAGDGFELAARLRVGSPAEAQQLAAMFDAQAGVIKPFVDRIEIVDEDIDVKIAVAMTQGQVDTAMAMAAMASGIGGP